MRDKTDTKSAALLDMASGASDGFDEDGISENVDDVAAGSTGKLSFDEDRIPVVNDEILQSLQQEVSHVMENIKSMAPREHGRRRCPLCPFRSFTELRIDEVSYSCTSICMLRDKANKAHSVSV